MPKCLRFLVTSVRRFLIAVAAINESDVLLASASNAIVSSVGGALEVAQRAGGAIGGMLAQIARSAFVSGMDLGLRAGAIAVLAGAVLAFVAFPVRRR